MARRKVIAFPSRKRKYSSHEKLKKAVEEKLRKEGYEVFDLKVGIHAHEIIRKVFGKETEEKYFAGGEKERYPDLIARKGKEKLIIEIKSNRELSKLIKQLENYQKLGKTILVLETDTSNIELWGLQNLGDIHITKFF